jgi:hypothetical protein
MANYYLFQMSKKPIMLFKSVYKCMIKNSIKSDYTTEYMFIKYLDTFKAKMWDCYNKDIIY